ncbi:Cobalt-zinc-cadmium resistance protein CzcA [Planctomycetes bacterium Pan216]|uniref:Cobalt-zinc-cadmium resistance protein CzcA n=1 Tax=Kolteria novifilia TaxID=2527975 RepID=A0A518B053_9BACT|nr:Cobalt-zinc-cadmium resistance protein CzcA [Planctomycetes bacterium Pan216]
MLNAVIRLALKNRLLVIGLALVIAMYGSWVTSQLSIDVFPQLTRPRVTIMTEAPGLAPEEVETLVTFPLETALNGAAGVETVRSSSGIGLSIIFVEFGWNADIYTARQIVQERMALASEQLPEGITPQLAPISSILGQIMLVGLWSEEGKTDPLELRTLADWVLRQRLLAIPGVAQVISMGGGRKQYQVLVNPDSMRAYGVTLHDVDTALAASNLNVTGGYLESGSSEFLVRGLGRVETLDDIEKVVVKRTAERSILIRDVARVVAGPQVKRGDSSVNGRYPGVILTIQKQPGADTRRITEDITKALLEFKETLPEDIGIDENIFQQRMFIDRGVDNVVEALRDGAILVVIILFLFLMDLRTTFITLTAIPLSVLVTALVFYSLEMSINVMTLGGLAVAIGELVDDAIVDVENIHRRLKENAASDRPRPVLTVVYEASIEIRRAIVFGTMLVILVFLPLFALSGMEGRLFVPMGLAYIVSILASLAVSLTVTPVLSSFLLGRGKSTGHDPEDSERDGFLLRWLKYLMAPIIHFGIALPGMILTMGAVLVIGAFVVLANLGADFLPEFDEGAVQVNVILPPGSSLSTSNRLGRIIDERFRALQATSENPTGPILSFGRKTGRAENDEHIMEVNVSEYVIALNPESGLSRREVLKLFRDELKEIPGIQYEVEQPLAHLISHMLSGVTAQIGIKVYGDDLDVLRRLANEIKGAIQSVPGIAPPVVEPMQLIPQIRIELNRDELALYGITPKYVNDFIETAMNGAVISSVLDGQRTFDLLVRLDEPYRKDITKLNRLSLDLPDGGRIPISSVAKVYEGGGPNTINRENVRRRVTIRVNTTDRDLGSAVADIKRRIAENVTLPEGYFIEYGGQFEAQEQATRMIGFLSLLSLAGVFLVLYTTLPSVRIVLQIMVAIPAAFVGGVAALALSGQVLTVASLVGFISLAGIASRNGILLVSHYLHLMRFEGEEFNEKMVLRGSLERLAPVLMTALTTGIGLVPLVWGGQAPGREILYPVATVIVGGLTTSTLCEFLIRPGIFLAFSGSAAKRLVEGIEPESPASDDSRDKT